MSTSTSSTLARCSSTSRRRRPLAPSSSAPKRCFITATHSGYLTSSCHYPSVLPVHACLCGLFAIKLHVSVKVLSFIRRECVIVVQASKDVKLQAVCRPCYNNVRVILISCWMIMSAGQFFDLTGSLEWLTSHW